MPEALRAAGWLLQTHHEVFGERDEAVPDAEWLERCGRAGTPVLTKDGRLRYRPEEVAVIVQHRVKAFVLARRGLRAAEQVDRFQRNREAIVGACTEEGPIVYSVQADRIARVFPP